MIRKIFPLILLLLLLTIYCDDNGNDNTPPQPTVTPTPSYANIQCVSGSIFCLDDSTITDCRVRAGAIFQNYGTAMGTSWVMLWIEQPKGVVIGTYQTRITLRPNKTRLIQYTFSEPTFFGGTVWCFCGIP